MARVKQRRNLGGGAEKHREERESGQLLNINIMFYARS
jgi:hypothetical protein